MNRNACQVPPQYTALISSEDSNCWLTLQDNAASRAREVAAALGLIASQAPRDPQLLEQYLATLAEGEFTDAVMGFMTNLPATRPVEGPEALPGASGLAGLMQVRVDDRW